MHIHPMKRFEAFSAAEASMKRNKVPGMAMALLINGKTQYHQTFGLADPESGRPVTLETHFEAASLTKPVFSKLVYQLLQEHILDLDTPICAYLPDGCPSDDPAAAAITARHVLSHGSGLPNWGKAPLSLRFKPGMGFGYSGTGYTYLQSAVEKLTGRRTDDLMQTEIFNPLKMDDAAMIWTGPLNRTLARTVDENGQLEAPRNRCQHTVALEPNCAFSLHVTIQDYPKFLESVLADPHYLDWVVSGSIPADHEIQWGLGWGIYRDLIWHWGDNGGFKSFVCFDRHTKDGILMHTNGYNGLEVCYDTAACICEYDFTDIRKMIAHAEFFQALEDFDFLRYHPELLEHHKSPELSE